jgi:hypothetical protein
MQMEIRQDLTLERQASEAHKRFKQRADDHQHWKTCRERVFLPQKN